MTREVQASEAETNLAGLLDEVERGETIVVTRHGRRIARIVRVPQRRPQKEIDEAIANIKALQKEAGKVTLEELLSWRHEGHKY